MGQRDRERDTEGVRTEKNVIFKNINKNIQSII